ncbi:hypothetical protein GTP81_14425 [Rugamonas sp. FT107W]|uniref:Uncharacterized protein n=1 Tax=Duganella vulcania TaxID=2692166 RepID=A0A845HKL1_9BURK|nr:hypothetical protein [Duganella vulcania]MYN17953.1 hypothetical protein [Duganella vulcania]
MYSSPLHQSIRPYLLSMMETFINGQTDAADRAGGPASISSEMRSNLVHPILQCIKRCLFCKKKGKYGAGVVGVQHLGARAPA